MLRVLGVFIAILSVALGYAQVPEGNPLVDAVQSFGVKGLGGEKDAGVSTKFKASGSRIYLDKYLKMFDDSPETRDALKQVIEAGIGEYEKAAKELKQENDAAHAYAFSLLLVDTAINGVAYEESAYGDVTQQVRFALKGIKATDAQKQEFYEWSLCTAFTTVGIASVLKGDDGLQKFVEFAEAEFTLLTGAAHEQSSFIDRKYSIVARPKEKAPEPTGGLVEGFSYSLPEGWVEENGWISCRQVYLTDDLIGANVRMLPAIKATGDLGATIRDLWQKNLPEELKGKASGMVFRRYIGDGLPAHFIFGQGQVTGQQADSLYSLYIVDCGAYWQPFVVAQTWHDPDTAQPLGTMFSAPLSFGTSADLAEVFFRTLKCPSGKGRALIDKTAIVGDYSFGSHSQLQWENIYTGASTMTFVSYGGTLNFAANGTFTYTYSSASGQVGAARFGGQKGNGKWTLQGDILTCRFSAFEQSDGAYKATEYVYRVAGVITYTDGVKVLVLKQKLDMPINAVSVRDSSDYYTTKKK